MLPLFSTSYSTKQLYDFLEILDTHDALKKVAYDNALAEAEARNKNK